MSATLCSCGLVHIATHKCGGNCSCVDAYRTGPDGSVAKDLRIEWLEKKLAEVTRRLVESGRMIHEVARGPVRPPAKKGPCLNWICECEWCRREYLAANQRSRWCPMCRKEGYRQSQLDAAKVVRAKKRLKIEKRRKAVAA